MERTSAEIQEQIEKLEAARKVTRARNGYAHYSERISYLKGELMLQREKERSEGQGRQMVVCSWCGKRQAIAFEGCWNCGTSLTAVGARR